MASDTSAGIGLWGQYYDNADLTGLALTRVDSNINFSWGTGSPSALIGADTFSVRWSGQIEAIYTEPVNFFVNADDGVRLWVDGQLLVDRWSVTPVVNATSSIPLIAGRKYDLQLEYFENTNSAAVSLEWSSASQPRSIVPMTRLFPSERGSILKETWTGISGSSIAALTTSTLFPNSPNTVSRLSNFELVSNVADSYGDRLRGLLFAPTTGEYTFYIAGDETAELWLSNSAEAGNKQLMASVPSPTLSREWNKFPSQRSSVVNLVAGQSYYIEALHKEATGNDHLAVGWTLPGQSSIDVIEGQYLAAILPTVSIYSDSPVAGEGTGGPGRLSFVRSGTSTTNPLTVSYTVRGTAINGTDYTTLPGTIVIPAGQSSVSMDITAITDSITEGTETVIIELLEASGYETDRLSQRTANVTIQDNTNAPAGGVSLLAGTSLSNFSSFGGTFSTVTDPSQGSVIQAAITSQQTSPWNSQLRQSINGSVSNGDILYFEFYVRSVNSSGIINAIFEINASPFTKSLDQGVLVTQTWSRVQMPFLSAGDYAAGQAAIGFHLGAQIQTLQFAGFQLLKYGPTSKLESATGISLQNIGGSFGTIQTVAVTGQTFTSAAQIDTTSTPANGESWRLQGLNVSDAPVVNGDVLQLDFWVRGIAGTNPRVAIVVQESFGSFATLYFNQISLTNNWQKISINLAVTKDYAKNRLQVTFNAGFAPQSIQIADFTWRNTTRGVDFNSLPSRTATATYAGRSGTDSWRTDAETRIIANRMGSLTVNVVDSNGTAINGAVVQLRQKKQDFKFGSAVNGYNNLLSGTSAEALKYQSEIKRLFNTVVVENNLKWPDFLNNRAIGIDAANWASSNGLYLRGHNIVWPSRDYVPSSVWSQYDSLLASQGATAAASYLRTTIRARVADAASTFRGIAGEWDVVNEPYSNHDVMDILGNDELLEWFRIYRTNDPTGKRVLNDYDIFSRNGGNTDHRTNFAYWLDRLTNPDGNHGTADSLIEILGEQSHYGESNLTDMAVLGQLIQSYNSTYNLPIAITEFDVNTRNEQLQADYLRDYMTMVYSQPAVTEFLQWGFWSKSHWLPSAALYRDDFSIKPNGQAYEDLVFGDWWSVTRGTTRGGQVQSKVFTGDFDVVVVWNGQTVSSTVSVGLSGSAVNVVIPNFHVPNDILLSSSTVLENKAINAVVGTIDAVDKDASSSFVFSLVAGSGSTDNASFNVSGSSLLASSSFDFEAKSVYSIRVRATDQTGLATERVLQIYVKNLLETEGASTDLIVPLYQYPNFTDGTRTQLSGWWQDIKQSASAAQPITVIVNPNSGPIDPQTSTLAPQYQDYLSALRLLRANPYVRVVGYLPTGYGQIALPQVSQFLGWYANGYKDAIGGSLIDGIFLDEYSNEASQLGYYRSVRDDIRSRSALAANFIIGNTGVAVANAAYYTEPVADVFLSYENVESPVDGPGLSSLTLPTNAASGVSFGAIVHSAVDPSDMQRIMKTAKSKGYGYVFITNDLLPNPYDAQPVYWSSQITETHRPVVQPQSFTTLESAATGFVVGAVVAFDPDPSQTISYSITQGNTGGAFAISSTGILTVMGPLNFEAITSYSLTIQVLDSSTAALSDSAVITIIVGDVNETPVLTRALANISGDVLATLDNTGTWSDPDGNAVTLSASLGAVAKNANGTWAWSYTPPNVVTNQVVTVTANDGINSSSVTFTINAVAVTPTLTITSGNRTYDRTAYSAVATLSGNATPVQTITYTYFSDATGTNAIAAPVNAGTYFVRASVAANTNNNAAQSAIAAFTINRVTLVASATVSNKPFDNTTAASISTRSLSGVISPDVVTLSGGAGTFADIGVGNNKTVTVTGLVLGGADVGNYTANTTATTLANITTTVFNRQLFYNDSGYETSSGIPAALSTTKVLLRSSTAAQTTSFANVSNYSRGLNGVVLDIAGLTASSLAASDFVFRVAPAGASGVQNPSTWALAPLTSAIAVTAGTATVPGRVRLEWVANSIENTWLQIIVKANANTSLTTPQTFYLGHAMGEVNGATPYRLTGADLSLVQAGISNAIVSVNDIRDVNKDRRVTGADLSFVQSRISNTVLLNNITIPASGSSGEGSGSGSGGSGDVGGVGGMGVGVTGTDDGSPLDLRVLMGTPAIAGASLSAVDSSKSAVSSRFEEKNQSPVYSVIATSSGALIQLDKTQFGELDSMNRVDKIKLTMKLEIRLNDDFFSGFDSIGHSRNDDFFASIDFTDFE